MRTVGIVAEFNPFHNGHAHLIAEARRRGATHIAVAMSGAAVQRGEPAICSKHERAAAAIANGADLVAELPSPYSCSAANYFADAAVQILVQLGVSDLAFGSEYSDAEILLRAAEAVEALGNSEVVRAHITAGKSYPAALAAAAEEMYGRDVSAVIGSPNSTLACEYILALKRRAPHCGIMPIERIGAGHDMPPENGIASGSYLRKCLTEDAGTLGGFFPDNSLPKNICDPRAAEKVILYHLITADKDRLMELPDMNERLADRMIKAAENPPSNLGDMLMSVKSRDFTLARIRRCALQLTLRITSADLVTVPYIRVLALSEKGREILKNAKASVPVSTSLKKLEDSSEAAKRITAIENRAVRLMELGTECFENEYTRKIAPCNNYFPTALDNRR